MWFMKKKEVKEECRHDWKSLGSRWVDTGIIVYTPKRITWLYCPKCNETHSFEYDTAEMEMKESEFRKEYDNG